jgi:hypothetical protein
LINPDSGASFGTPAVRDALVALRPQVTTAGACRWWCNAINCVARGNESNEALFRVDAVRAAHAALKKIASTSDDAKAAWDNAAALLQPAAAASKPQATSQQAAPAAAAVSAEGLDAPADAGQ